MNEDLIVQAIRQVLADPRIQALLGAQLAPASGQPELLVLLNYSPDLPQLLVRLCNQWGASYALKVLPTAAVERSKPALPAGMSWVTCQEALAGAWQRMVLPNCSANTLAKIALGLRDTPVCIMAAEGISKGIPVELEAAHPGFTPQAPAAYRQLYEGYLKQVQSYGVIVGNNLSGEQTAAAAVFQPASGSGQAIAAPGGPVINWGSKLLTEKDVLAWPADCTVRLNPAAIISPLAKDMIRRRRIEIRREGDVRR